MPQASAVTTRAALPAAQRSHFRWLVVGGLLAAGLLLRVFFVRRHAFLAGDSLLYQDIAQNWLYRHVYGFSSDAAPRPTLIRLPGYPAILAALAWFFDSRLDYDTGTLGSFEPVLWLQVVADLATCWFAACIARALCDRRAATVTLLLGCLCPFTANYTAVPLTEAFTLFFLALTFLLLLRWLQRTTFPRLAALAGALSCSVMLRPDQGLLVLAVLPVLFFAEHDRTRWTRRLLPVLLCSGMAAAPFLPWTVRNWRTFHVIEPLAPKQANDPGEVPPVGFQRWYRTWAVDFTSTEDAYWKYPDEAVQINDLPPRAFDSPAERDYVATLLRQDRWTQKLDPAVEARFAALGRERAHRHPLRTYLLLPAARLLNMLLHPRTEMLPVAGRWWQLRQHPAQMMFASAYAGLNLAYFLLAIAGAAALLRLTRAHPVHRMIVLSMLAYIGLRCALLLTLDNPEQRYTLEFFPILFVFGGACWATRTEQRS